MAIEDFIAEKVEELCLTQGISKYRLAQKTGMTQTALSKITSKKCVPTITTIEKICGAFGISLAQFFAGNQNVVDLTEDQKEILNTWNNLDEEEKRIFLNFTRCIKVR